MSSKRKEAEKREKKRQRREEKLERERQKSGDDALVSETTAVFTCSYELAKDFRDQCDTRIEDLEDEMVFNRVACEIWNGQAGRGELIHSALQDFLAERSRYLETVQALRDRFDRLADPSIHDHLDPPERYRTITSRILFPEAPPTRSQDPEPSGR